MKYINAVNKIGYQNANDAQKRRMYELRKKYGDTIYKAGKFDANNLSKNNQVLYQKYNPYADFTRNRQESQFNLIGEKMKNNQALSDKQLKAYQTYGNKWNLTPHDKRAMSYQEATEQASKQVDPIYQQAVKGLQKEKYQNELNAGQVAANRGLGRSGLAADQLNKIAIATQGQMGELGAQRSSQIAELAQALQSRDQDRLDRLNQFEYQKSRDAVMDRRYDQEFANNNKRYQDEKAWREYTYKNMSASERAQLDWTKSQYGEEQAWRMYELQYGGELQKSMNQAQLDLYGAMDFLP